MQQGSNNSKIWLWVLGWIVIFPVPLMILLNRRNDMKPITKYGIIGGVWAVYLVIGIVGMMNRPQGDNNRTKASKETTKSTVANTDERSMPETTETTRKAVEVKSIDIQGDTDELVLGQTVSLVPTFNPQNADDKVLKWTSSNVDVASVDNEGKVLAVGDGKATITATSSNGKSSSFDVKVDGSKCMMALKTSHSRLDDNNIGDEWSYSFELNGEPAYGDCVLAVGDKLKCHARISEDDEKPDVGEETKTYKVGKDDLKNGFEVSFDVYVKENGGRNKGKKAHFEVKYVFSPKQ